MTARERPSLATLGVLLERALERSSGDACVAWAVEMLVAERGGRAMRMLAGMTPPFSHFEMASLRDAALAEVGLGPTPRENVVYAYVAARLETALDAGDPTVLWAAVDEGAQLHRELGLDSELEDLYFFALFDDDREALGVDVWHGESTLDDEAREKARDFVRRHRDAV